MKHNNYCDVLIAAGNSVKMQEESGIEPMCKWMDAVTQIYGRSFDIPKEYEFPLAVVEGKPVFVGDELYHERIGKVIILGESGTFLKINNPNTFSWNPPKPKIVMVELLREDVEWLAQYHVETSGHILSVGKACRKALEEK